LAALSDGRLVSAWRQGRKPQAATGIALTEREKREVSSSTSFMILLGQIGLS
jgi:hypothetical protein